MKNVTGYDLSKLMTGSYGTLGVFTDLTLKVLPKAEMEETLLIRGLDEATAVRAMTEASGLPHEVSSFAHLPAGSARDLDEPYRTPDPVTALRLEGPEVSVTKRKQDLIEHFKGLGAEFDRIDPGHSRTFWQALRDCRPLANRKADIWRVSTAPANGASFIAALCATEIETIDYYYDWAGGLVWLAVDIPASRAATILSASSCRNPAICLRPSRSAGCARAGFLLPFGVLAQQGVRRPSTRASLAAARLAQPVSPTKESASRSGRDCAPAPVRRLSTGTSLAEIKLPQRVSANSSVQSQSE
jgi:hypothetical protein